MLVYKYSEQMEHSKWIKEIPYINFPSNWQVQVSPPFAGAVVRFRVKCGNAEISIYLDCYDKLGIFGEPYWEIYPHEHDVYRCAMADVDDLLKNIQHAIDTYDGA